MIAFYIVIFYDDDRLHFIWPAGLFFHVVGEGVVRLLKNGRQHISDRENYIDFRMRLLGEPGTYEYLHTFTFSNSTSLACLLLCMKHCLV